jgi:hypothetical protein
MRCYYIKWRKSDFENGASQAKPVCFRKEESIPGKGDKLRIKPRYDPLFKPRRNLWSLNSVRRSTRPRAMIETIFNIRFKGEVS